MCIVSQVVVLSKLGCLVNAPAVECCAAAKVYLTYDAKLRAFLIFKNLSYVEVWFCPWCGAKLPTGEEPTREDAADGC